MDDLFGHPKFLFLEQTSISGMGAGFKKKEDEYAAWQQRSQGAKTQSGGWSNPSITNQQPGAKSQGYEGETQASHYGNVEGNFDFESYDADDESTWPQNWKQMESFWYQYLQMMTGGQGMQAWNDMTGVNSMKGLGGGLQSINPEHMDWMYVYMAFMFGLPFGTDGEPDYGGGIIDPLEGGGPFPG